MSETIELRFHRVDRPCVRVGTLKNGAGIYRLYTTKGTKEYLVRRKAKSETAKGYGQATELTNAQLADRKTVFTCPKAQAFASQWLANVATQCRDRIAGNLRHIEQDQANMAKMLESGDRLMTDEYDPRVGKTVRILFYEKRAVSEAHLDEPSKVYTVMVEQRWGEDYLTIPNRYTGKSKLDRDGSYYSRGWQTPVPHRFLAPGYYDNENIELTRDASKYQAASERLAA